DVTFTRTAGSSVAAPRSSGPASPFGQTFSRGDLSDEGRRIAGALGGGLTLLDFDGDGSLDVVIVWPGGVRLLRNDRGTFVDVTASSGLTSATTSGGIGVVAGDYDNDGR